MPLSPSESIVAAALAAIMVGRIEAMAIPVSPPSSVTPGGSSSQQLADSTPCEVGRSSHSPVSRALAASWAASTRRNYDRSFASYLNWCTSKRIPVENRVPASEDLLCDYGASFAGNFSGSTARNALAGVRALHIFYNAPWKGGMRLQQVLRGVENLRPSSSFAPARRAITINHLLMLCDACDAGMPLDAACLAAATTAFWCQTRLGELLPVSRARHDLSKFPSRSDLGSVATAKGSRTLRLPWTKTTGSQGASVMICYQSGAADPISAMANHLAVNNGPSDLPLFGYRGNSEWAPLTKRSLLGWCNRIWAARGESYVFMGHSFRIGGTTELLLRGIPPDVVKLLGRWESDAFLAYWRSADSLAHIHVEDSNVSPLEPTALSRGLPPSPSGALSG